MADSIIHNLKFYIILTLLLFFIPQTVWSSNAENFKVFSVEDREKGGYKIYAINKNIIPYFVNLKFHILDNLKPSINKPYQMIVPPNNKKSHIMDLIPIDNQKGNSMKYECRYQRGDPINTVHEDSYLYFFPFKHGVKKKVLQGYHGKFSHSGANEYAVDFDLKIGEKIYAARDGVVIEAKEDSDKGGVDESYAEYANSILVYHSDGSFGSYAHLKKNGVLVNVKDKVRAGDLIGYSGNTGISSGPHLHFSVNVPQIYSGLQSIPIRFLNYNQNSIDPEEGEYYYATHTGKSKFKVIFGSHINNKDYAGYIKNVSNNNKMNIRSEKIDDTILLFLQNGYNSPYSVSIKIELGNLKASNDFPVTKSISALSEIFVSILRPLDPKKAYKYSINTSYKPD